MTELSSIQAHVLKMIEWIEWSVVLGVEPSIEMSINLNLQSLGDSFSQFIVHFNMHKF